MLLVFITSFNEVCIGTQIDRVSASNFLGENFGNSLNETKYHLIITSKKRNIENFGKIGKMN